MWAGSGLNLKERRARDAKQHTAECDELYEGAIRRCIQKTIVYSPSHVFKTASKNSYVEWTVEDLDSVSAIIKHADKSRKTAVLNFASYKHPGGMFLEGAAAQEECLCHESILYNVLREFQGFYDWNVLHKNRAMYLNRALYTPKVIFMRDGKEYASDVITCAAPNLAAAKRYLQVSDKENEIILGRRIRFVLDIASDNGVETLILGAYGCGVFGQNPKVVAEIFKDALRAKSYGFQKVVFAIPEGNGNLQTFKNIIK